MEWCGCWVVLAELSSWWVGEKGLALAKRRVVGWGFNIGIDEWGRG